MPAIRGFIALILIFYSSSLFAQCDLWGLWYSQGSPPWHQWITLAPGLMGPNALPVPEVGKGQMPATMIFENRVDAHFMPGDRTQNLFSRLFVPFSERIAIQLYMVPVEHYDMSCALKRERHTHWGREKQGFAVGDVYFGTVIQLVKDHPKWPDILLRMHGKTASGNKLHNLRYTDTPGYFFDVSFGKSIPVPSGREFRFYGMAGFYVWQTFDEIIHQNDAFLYGAGFDWTAGKLKIVNQMGGYAGYVSMEDQPLVYRGELHYDNNPWQYYFRYQKGLHDFEYQTFSVGIQYRYDLLAKLGWDG